MNKEQENTRGNVENPSNKDQQGVDKSPGEGVGQGSKVSNDDLKGKKVDADLNKPEDQPIRQLP